MNNLKSFDHDWSKIAESVTDVQRTKSAVFDSLFLGLVHKYVEKNNEVLDYHSEWGEYSEMLTKDGYDVTALNESEVLVESAKKRYKNQKFFSLQEFKDSAISNKKFDFIYSNLWMCILSSNDHKVFFENINKIIKDEGLLLLSFCHPCFDFMQDSIVTHRVLPKEFFYDKEFSYSKIIHENGIHFIDNHRPLEYYTNLFVEQGYSIIDIKESDVLGTTLYPDFIFFLLKKNAKNK